MQTILIVAAACVVLALVVHKAPRPAIAGGAFCSFALVAAIFLQFHESPGDGKMVLTLCVVPLVLSVGANLVTREWQMRDSWSLWIGTIFVIGGIVAGGQLLLLQNSTGLLEQIVLQLLLAGGVVGANLMSQALPGHEQQRERII